MPNPYAARNAWLIVVVQPDVGIVLVYQIFNTCAERLVPFAFLVKTNHPLHIMFLGQSVFVLRIDVCGLVDIVATTFGY